MKQIYKLKSKLFLCVLIFMSSCTEVLDIKPVSSITNSSFWNTEDDAKGALSGMYVYFRNLASENLFIWGEARSEVMGSALGTTDFTRYYNNTLNVQLSGPNWQSLYTAINATNLIIKHVPDIDIPSEISKNNILAQAFTTRAYLYFVLARTWGGVPIRTEPTEGYNSETTQKSRSTIEEVFKLIKEDLNLALPLFENNNFFAGRSQWSRPAANALKAEVYLWTGKRLNGGTADFSIALEACNEVQKADIQLLPNFADLFEYSNKRNKEILMALAFDAIESGRNIYYSMYSGETSSSLDPINGEVIGRSSDGMVWTVTQLVRDQFTVDDKRKNPSFAEVPNYPTLIRKFRGTLISGLRYFTSDIILYRYADVLLMKAEAKNALGQDPSEEINSIRRRAYGDTYNNHIFVNGTKAQNDDTILKERLLELVFEGKRWWDLVRFDKAFDIVPSLKSRKGQDFLLLWPIGQSTLSLEPEIKQNPGW